MLMLLLTNLHSTELYSQQSKTVTGFIFNIVAEYPVLEATVCILNAKDSILVNFGYSGMNGTFQFKGLPNGNYLLLISCPNCADYVEPFNLDSVKSGYDFDTIRMNPKEILLQEVLINARRDVMKIKGDTIEYDVRAFDIQPNDKVEDLLKRLPGIQVDQHGKITAQGQTVTKVLLDGEEFFADDPTLVTKNIRADMVDKIEVYDKKSDQAAFTGIEDGVRTRTINVKLKEDKKNGLFGKTAAGMGTDDYYEAQAMFNRFKKESKFSAYGTIANDGKTGLSYNDLQNIGSKNINLAGKGLESSGTEGNQLETYDGNYAGIGFPKTKNGGAHYETKWAAGNRSLNANYQLGAIHVDGNNTNLTQQILADGTLESRTEENYDNQSIKQRLNATYKMIVDSSSDLKIDLTGGTQSFDVNRNYRSNTTGVSDNPINLQERSITNSGDLQGVNLNTFYTKKFGKERRTLSWEMNGDFNDSHSEGYLNSHIDFYNTYGTIDSIKSLDQLKKSAIENLTWASRFEYTEPLPKNLTLLLRYGISIDNSTIGRKSLNYVDGMGYIDPDEISSNRYKLKQLMNLGGIRLNYAAKDKVYFNFGTDVTAVTFNQHDFTANNSYSRNFLNWSPELYLSIYMKQWRYISAHYSGSNTLPTVEQIQPVQNNTDPLNIRLGNPGLKPSFSNKIRVDYSSNNRLKGNRTYIRFDYTLTEKAITEDFTTDIATGKGFLQYTNLLQKPFYSYNVYADFSRSLGNSGLHLYLSIGSRKSVSRSFINHSLNTAKSGSYTGSIGFYWSKSKKLELNAAFKPDYSINSLSLQPQYDNNAKGYIITGNVKIFLPAKFELNSDIDYSYRGSTSVFADFDRTIWNASVSRAFLKGNNLKFSISGYDLLNQNRRFDRSVAGNTFRQYTSTVIQRYFMVSLSWDFTKFGILPSANP